jgi:4-amino-4-deoxy-L-arabinose transferase-like glycosyltransferase
MVTIWAAFKTGKLLFPQSRLSAFALPLLIVFHPQYVFVNTYANNDSTVSAAASVAIYLAAVSLKQGLDIRRTAWLGVALALITVSKYSGLCVVPVVFVFMLLAGWLNNASVKSIALNMSVLILLPVSITAGFFIRNFLVFNGDILGTQTMYKTWSETFHIEVRGQVSLWRTIKDGLWWRQVFDSFWGVFGYQNRYLPTKVYDTYLFLVLGGISGLLLQAFTSGRKLLSSTINDKAKYIEPAIWTMLTVAFLANVYAMIYAASVNLGGPQGRYLFATELPAMALLLAGMRVYGKAGRVMAIGLVVFNAIVAVAAWYMLWQLFGFQAKPY